MFFYILVIPTPEHARTHGRSKRVAKETLSFHIFAITWNTTFHDKTVDEKNVIPILDIVAGEALSTLSGSKQSLALGAITILSPFAKVRVLLSSKTEFKFSIHTASTGPSNTIQQYSLEFSCNNVTY